MRSMACKALALAVVVGPRVAPVLHMVTAALSLVARRANFTSLVVALQGVALELLAGSPLYQLLCSSVLDGLLLLLIGREGVGPSGRGLDRRGLGGVRAARPGGGGRRRGRPSFDRSGGGRRRGEGGGSWWGGGVGRGNLLGGAQGGGRAVELPHVGPALG